MFVLYLISFLTHLRYPLVGRWIMICVLIIWFFSQYFTYVHPFFMSRTEEQLKVYYSRCEGCLRLIPVSTARAIPDLYHFVMTVLALINIVLLCVYSFSL